MDIETIENTFHRGNDEDKAHVLSHLCDIFESFNERINDFSKIVYVLINFAINETDIKLKEEAFHTLSTAAANKDIRHIEMDLIVKNIDILPISCLLDAIDILSFTHDKKHLELLVSFLNHADKRVVYSAAIAIREIEEGVNGDG